MAKTIDREGSGHMSRARMSHRLHSSEEVRLVPPVIHWNWTDRLPMVTQGWPHPQTRRVAPQVDATRAVAAVSESPSRRCPTDARCCGSLLLLPSDAGSLDRESGALDPSSDRQSVFLDLLQARVNHRLPGVAENGAECAPSTRRLLQRRFDPRTPDSQESPSGTPRPGDQQRGSSGRSGHPRKLPGNPGRYAW